MGSLRNPVGPLPSSIYWRRRAVLLSLFAVLALLAAWVVTSGGGGGNGSRDGANGKNPAPTITPGPSSSGPAISQAPGGRDESEGGNDGGTGGGSDDGNGEGPGGGSGSGDGSGRGGSGDGGSGGGAAAGTGVGTGSGDTVPAGSPLPNCTPAAVKLSLRSLRNTYEPGQTPTFVLAARNVSGNDCKLDLGPKNAVLTVTPATADDEIWASDDCPKDAGGRLYRVPSDSGITYTVKWDRRPSAPECATPSAGTAKPGTYLVEAKAPGFAKVQTSFVIEAA